MGAGPGKGSSSHGRRTWKESFLRREQDLERVHLPWEQPLYGTSSHGSRTWKGEPPPTGAGPGKGSLLRREQDLERDLLPWEQSLERDLLPREQLLEREWDPSYRSVYLTSVYLKRSVYDCMCLFKPQLSGKFYGFR
jgi:hypothetical protein